jgi:LPS sulfotransferase NodH
LIPSIEELVDKATSLTGLTDFGDDDYSDGLAALHASFAADAGLTEAGQKAARGMLRGALMARLLSEAGFAQYPSYADVPVQRPVFVTGLPRTGTTFLHRLLVADPGHQGLEMWLAEAPQPRPPRSEWDANPAYQYIAAGVARHQAAHPAFGAVHEVGADQVEECWQLLRQSFRSVSYECLYHLPSYSSWLSGQDWVRPYRRHRRNLQLLGLHEAGKRWVLKNPSHLFTLDALMTVYPDALVIVTHRPPRTAIASMCSLAAQASDGWSPVFEGAVIGRDQLETWARGLSLFNAARSRYPAAQFYDVAYDDLVASPLDIVEQVYERLEVSLSGAAADAMRELVPGRTAEGPRSVHRYTLADFGLTGEEIDERFADYRHFDQARARLRARAERRDLRGACVPAWLLEPFRERFARAGSCPAGWFLPGGPTGRAPTGRRAGPFHPLAGPFTTSRGTDLDKCRSYSRVLVKGPGRW